jgi:hypothetical protein
MARREASYASSHSCRACIADKLFPDYAPSMLLRVAREDAKPTMQRLLRKATTIADERVVRRRLRRPDRPKLSRRPCQ